MFSKLFKKNTPKSTILPKENPEPGSTLYPIIKSGTWVGIDQAIWYPWFGPDEHPDVVIAFGKETPEGFTFVTKEKAAGLTTAQILNTCIGHIRELYIPQEITTIQGQKIITASGHPFSSEKILDEVFLQDIGNQLGTNKLLISIPRRTCFMACSANVPESFLHVFEALHKEAWHEDSYGNAPIVNSVFVAEDGVVKNIVPIHG